MNLKHNSYGLMFHHFHNTNVIQTGQGSISAKKFEKIIKLIGIENILHPNIWIEKYLNNNLSEYETCITFDDSLLCQYEIALPVLESLKLSAFWFIYSSVFENQLEEFELYRKFRNVYYKTPDEFYKEFFKEYSTFKKNDLLNFNFENQIDIISKKYPFYSRNDIIFRLLRDEILSGKEYINIMNILIEKKQTTLLDLSKNLWMTNEHLKKLNTKGHKIGLHAYNHPTFMSDLSYTEQKKQITMNYDHIFSTINVKPDSMSYPNNSYNEDTIQIIKSLGVKCSFRSNLSPIKSNSPLKQFFIPRRDHSTFN